MSGEVSVFWEISERSAIGTSGLRFDIPSEGPSEADPVRGHVGVPHSIPSKPSPAGKKSASNGFLVRDGDTAEAAEKLVDHLTSPALVRQMGEEGRAGSKQQSNYAFVENWAQVITGVVARSADADPRAPVRPEGCTPTTPRTS